MSTHPTASLILTLQQGHGTDDVIRLGIPGRYLIGTDQNSVVRLPAGAGASELHALLILEPEVLRLQDLATPGGTFVNGERIDSIDLQSGDSVRCGSLAMQVALDADPDAWSKTTVVVPRDENVEPLPEIQGYADLQPIGHGGLGTVYRARQLGTNSTVAIKCIRPELHADERTRSLFIREAAITARLKHPRIVQCLDFGLTRQHPYLVMEYISCESLESIAWRHDPNRRVRLAVKAMLHILEALVYAHEAGVVHRDIKPANVLASTAGGRLRVKLSDFGLAKVFDTAGYSGITQSNEICGTLAYMSPEQLLDSRNVRPDADVYAVVVCLYRLLTEEFPFAEGPPVEVIQRRLHENPRPVRTFNPNVPHELATIVDRGLSRTRELRFASAASLRTALSELSLLSTNNRRT